MELLEVFDEFNNSLNYSASRDEVHEKKLWHRHVSAWIMNNEGMILMQKRSLSKKKNPGIWSKTGGHVDYGENPDDAIKREIFEEIGLNVDNFKLMDKFKHESERENNYVYSYFVLTDKSETDFILQKDEVDSVKYFSIEELIENRGNQQFTFSRWDDKSFYHDMDLLKKYRDSLFNITAKEVFNKLISDNKIIDIYNKIEEYEIETKGMAFHNYNHIKNVTNIAINLLKKLNYDDNTIDEIKIACLLHDVGALEGKEGHANRSYEYSKKLFKDNNWHFMNKDKILDAIKNHSNGFDSDNILTLIIVLADKLDIKSSRITEEGMKVIGNRQYGHIMDILIDIVDKKLQINFITDNNLDKNEFNEYYFTKKVFKAIESFSNKLNLKYQVMIDNKEEI